VDRFVARASTADRLLQGDTAAAAALASRLVIPERDNLVERPWGGARLKAFKGLRVGRRRGAKRIGESFELAADDADDEARRHPSVVKLADGSMIGLATLLAVHADTMLGAAFVQKHGRRYPLLPKLLDVAELLSVQAHPPGNTEAYVIVAADRGATIRLGFAADVDADVLAEQLAAGRRQQQRLLDLLPAVDAAKLQRALQPWLAQRKARPAKLRAALERKLAVGASWRDAEQCLAALHGVYWAVLDALNTIPVAAGDVIYNANPSRVVAAGGRPASAEVHALGNPEGRGLLALEIRMPGRTFRAWDHVRFPLREIDIDAALGAVNLGATRRKEFVVARKPTRPGVQRSVDCDYFRLEHLQPSKKRPVEVPASLPHSLHALAGRVTVCDIAGTELGALNRGQSALVPVGVGAYRVVAVDTPAELVRVELPPYVG
jgi:mannose-6-phosphate isomerase class I